MAKITLLGISGSIRRQSTNTAVLKALQSRLIDSGGVTMGLFGLAGLPLFNSDLETPEDLPESVRALQEAARSCDGVVICAPEYNHGMSGVLKNALDWASRPYMNSPLKGKPALIMTAAPSILGGVRALKQTRDTLLSCHARVISRPDVVISKVHEKIVEGRLVDESTISFALQAIADLVDEIRLLRRS